MRRKASCELSTEESVRAESTADVRYTTMMPDRKEAGWMQPTQVAVGPAVRKFICYPHKLSLSLSLCNYVHDINIYRHLHTPVYIYIHVYMICIGQYMNPHNPGKQVSRNVHSLT